MYVNCNCGGWVGLTGEQTWGGQTLCNLGVLSTPHVMYVLRPRDASCLRLVSSWIRKRNILASAAFIIFYIIPRGGKATCPFTLVARVSHLNPVDCILSPPGNELRSCLLLPPPPYQRREPSFLFSEITRGFTRESLLRHLFSCCLLPSFSLVSCKY